MPDAPNAWTDGSLVQVLRLQVLEFMHIFLACIGTLVGGGHLDDIRSDDGMVQSS